MANKLATYYTEPETETGPTDLVEIIETNFLYRNVSDYLDSQGASFSNDFTDVLIITAWDDGTITSRVTKVKITLEVE